MDAPLSIEKDYPDLNEETMKMAALEDLGNTVVAVVRWIGVAVVLEFRVAVVVVAGSAVVATVAAGVAVVDALVRPSDVVIEYSFLSAPLAWRLSALVFVLVGFM